MEMSFRCDQRRVTGRALFLRSSSQIRDHVFYRRRAGDKPIFLSSHGMWFGDRDLTITLKIQACPSGMTLYQERFQMSKVTLSESENTYRYSSDQL
ncbi:unnamed protein product [Arctogadus glacialis]